MILIINLIRNFLTSNINYHIHSNKCDWIWCILQNDTFYKVSNEPGDEPYWRYVRYFIYYLIKNMLLKRLSIFFKLIFLRRFLICIKPTIKLSSFFITVKWFFYFYLTRSLSLLFLNKPLDLILFLFLFLSKDMFECYYLSAFLRSLLLD